MKILNVKTSRPYSIVITNGWQDLRCQDWGKKVLIVTDTNVQPLYLQQVQQCLASSEVHVHVIPAGEHSKNAQNYFDVLSALAVHAFTRKDAVVALGGGVVGDLAGFAAATYMRGVAFYQIPTTLLAMIDSSVGGKTAINLQQGKNLVGAFYQPFGVYVNLDTLQTLPIAEMQNGMGELVKYAFLSKTVAKGNLDNIDQQLIADCLKIKIGIVEKDERESSLRMLLNLGHTVGHAIECLSAYSLPHGLCVAKGIACAIDVSQKFYNLPESKVASMKALLAKVNLDTSVNFDKKQLAAQIVHDKKAQHDAVNFVMIKDIGNCQIVPIAIDKLVDLL